MDSDRVLSRRSLIRRALALFAGAVGLSALGPIPVQVAEAKSKPRYPYLVGIKGAKWHYWRNASGSGTGVGNAGLPTQDAGAPPVNGEMATLAGQLLDKHGKLIGYFRGTSAFVQGEFINASGATRVEQHVFTLPDGMLLGTGLGGKGKRVFVITGGTGKYAHASGTYAITESFIELGGGAVSLSFSVA